MTFLVCEPLHLAIALPAFEDGAFFGSAGDQARQTLAPGMYPKVELSSSPGGITGIEFANQAPGVTGRRWATDGDGYAPGGYATGRSDIMPTLAGGMGINLMG